MTVGENIKRIRKERHLSQRELGEKLGISQQMVGQYENNPTPPKLETLQKIATALKVPVSELDDRAKSSLNIQVRDQDGNIQTRSIDTTKLQQLIYYKMCTSDSGGLSDENITKEIADCLEKNWLDDTIGHNIRKEREACGLSQKELAKAVGISVEAISKYESDPKDGIPLIVLKKIAKVLRTTVNHIVFNSDEDGYYNYIDLEKFLNLLEWGVEYYVPCAQNTNCPLTENEKEDLSMGYYQRKCKKCSNNKIDYIIYNVKKSYLLSEQEYDDLESSILPYLKLRLNEYLSKKKPLSKKDLETMGLDWLAEP